MGKIVFITGASSGIGKALALEYAKSCAGLILFARRNDRLDEVKRECLSINSQLKVLTIQGSVTNSDDLIRAYQEIENTYGRLDIVVANAGYGVAGWFGKLKVEDYRRQFETNFFGLLHTLLGGLDLIKKSKGSLVLMGSVNSYLGMPKMSAYCSSKFAVKGLADSLRLELTPQGVAVTLICPGMVESEIRQVDNFGNFNPDFKVNKPSSLELPAKKAAQQMVRAINRRVPEVVITGHGKLIVWVERHIPWALHPFLRVKPPQKKS